MTIRHDAKPYMHLTHGEETGVAECGCVLHLDFGAVGDPAVVFCAVHDRARQLYEAAKSVLNHWSGGDLAWAVRELNRAVDAIDGAHYEAIDR